MSLSNELQKADVSRRSFLKGMAVLGAAGAVAGCSSSGDGDIVYGGGSGGNFPGAVKPVDLTDRSQFEMYGVTCPHNCGPSTQCLCKAWVKDGRIVRVTSEDTWLGPDGIPYNRDINDARKLACPRGRAIKGRVHHNGRLKYPMKQTKARGDLTGFVRISWEEAYDEVLRKYWAILAKYGTSAIHSGGPYNSGSTTGVVTTSGGSRNGYANHSFHQFMHAYPLVGVPGNTGWSSACNIGTQANYCYHGLIKHWVSFGANGMSTNSTLSHVYLMANKKAVELDPSFKHYIITPELTDTGVLCATDWVQIRNQTDPALIAGMIHHMITETFNADGTIKSNPMLDVDYIDTVLYGFFDSPEYMVKNAASGAGYFEGTDTNRGANITAANNPYNTLATGSIIVGDWEREKINLWINNTDGSVVKLKPTVAANYTWQPYRWKSLTVSGRYAYTAPARTISAVAPGRSYAAWLMGSDNRLTKAMYDDSRNVDAANAKRWHNYTAKSYVADTPKARAALCSYPIKGVPASTPGAAATTGYYTKKDYMTPKSPEWAEKICGTPAATIRELAELYANTANHPIITEWTGGLQKSENGCITLMAIQTLFAVTKCWGWSAGSVGTPHASYASDLPGSMGSDVALPAGYTAFSSVTPGSGGGARTGSANTTNTAMSCAEHHNGPYFAFKEKLNELSGKDAFIGSGNPEWNGEDRYLYDAPAAKAQVLYKRSGDNAGFVEVDIEDPDGVTRKYVDWVGREANKPTFAGKRMYIGGNGVMMNGVQATNWQAEMMSKLPLASDNPDDPDTFCLAAFDFHLHVHVRFADYVFPCASTFEEAISGSPGGRSFSSAALVAPPGEALTQWDAAYRGWRQRYKTLGNGSKTFSRIDGANDFTLTTPEDAHFRVIGETTSKSYKPQRQKFMENAQKTLNALATSSPFYGYSIKDYIALQLRGVNQQTVAAAPTAPSINNTARLNIDNYLKGTWATADLSTQPFITFASNRQMSPAAAQCMMGHTTATQAELDQYASGITGAGTGTAAGNALMGRMCCYIEYAVKLWEKSMDRFHGWLPFDKRGNKANDYEGDPCILPIPMYYDVRDSFNEMYGVFNTNPARRNLQTGWKLIGSKPETNDISLITDRLTITFGNTHDRFRSHSSTAEVGFTRELNTRTKGGGWASGNDWNYYGVIPDTDQNKEGGNAGLEPQRASAVAKKDMKIASWHEFWLNDEDCAAFGIKDGDLIRVSNPVGAVRAVARVTRRIVRGHGQLHHGAWYDPNPVDGVDDGACPGTLTCGRPSKLDNGNSLHCGYCVVEKETNF